MTKDGYAPRSVKSVVKMKIDEREKLLERLQYKIKMRDIYIRRLNKEIEEIRSKLSLECQHPEDFVKGYYWEWDDGYGTQREKYGRACNLCLKKDPWNNGRWI